MLFIAISSQAAGKNFLYHIQNDTAFLMAKEDMFNISGVEVMAASIFESGSISSGIPLEVKEGG